MTAQEMDALIVRHLKDIESASNRLNIEIQKNVGDAIDRIVKEWAGEKKWYSTGCVNNEETYLALAPTNWLLPDKEERDEKFYGWFWIDAFDNAGNETGLWNNEFWLTQLCGLGAGPLGICWGGEHGNFNTTNARWKAFLAPRVADFNNKYGFKYVQRDGVFYLPFTIDQEALATAIAGDNIEDALGPLTAALEIIGKAEDDSNSLLNAAKTNFNVAQQGAGM
jgi:hypothetical protein